MNFKKYFGPSTLVAAAFIGPGTLTICTTVGAISGYTLLWALLFSIIATIVLQEMAARLGLITQSGLGEAIRQEFSKPLGRILSTFLVIGAIVIGNGAYEAGNISGAVLGLNVLFGEFQFMPLVIGGIAFLLLNTGKYQLIERFLVGLVILMSLVFLATAIFLRPDLGLIFKGLFVPQLANEDLLLVIGLIGTTVVPYNLFLHASAIQQKFNSIHDLKDMRIENRVAIILGGIISICIVITSAAAFQNEEMAISNAADMAVQLEPILGNWAKYFMVLGLFAAGITSAITAPLAAAMAANGILGWNIDKLNLKDNRFRAVWMTILIIGSLIATLGIKPILIIQFAQVANGILLPVVASFLLYIMNKKAILKEHTNTIFQNILGISVILVTLFISFRSLNSVFGVL